MKINVLMSTYNGEMYLRQQIDSILCQKGVDINLIVRDDGSQDGTLDILEDYKLQNKLTWYKGENLGPARSFMDLLENSTDADFYAFSDQDDYWLEDKLLSALNRIIQYKNEPSLYFCQTQLVDKELNKIPSVRINPLINFGESLVYQFIGGCTMVFNKKLKDIVNQYKPHFLAMHDVWIYSIALAIDSHVYFDPTPHIYYRQHGNNVIGQGYGQIEIWKRRIHRLKSSKHERLKLAKELQNGFYKIMPQKNQQLLEKAILSGEGNFLQRLIASSDKRLRCANLSTYFLYRISSLLKTY